MTDLADETVAAPASPVDDRYRPELLAHCYRMLGSVHDAEDLVQETYLRAWRSRDRYEGRASVRTWLHKIATNVCLNALESRARRPLPSGLGAEAADPLASLTEQPEAAWLEPVPDALVAGRAQDPATLVEGRQSIRLAFIAALQHLPARQRAVLVLRDVLQWKAAEVAELLGTSTASVNSALQRARAQLDQIRLTEDAVVDETTPVQRGLLDRYVAAFENYDMEQMVQLFSADAVWEMPPFEEWFRGGEDIARLISTHCPASEPGDMRMLPTQANGQPAFALYMRAEDGVHRAFQIQVLTLRDERVSHVGAFFDTRLFATFGLPEIYPG